MCKEQVVITYLGICDEDTKENRQSLRQDGRDCDPVRTAHLPNTSFKLYGLRNFLTLSRYFVVWKIVHKMNCVYEQRVEKNICNGHSRGNRIIKNFIICTLCQILLDCFYCLHPVVCHDFYVVTTRVFSKILNFFLHF
jgi:hypothetical protein